jgi:hypothetical protein
MSGHVQMAKSDPKAQRKSSLSDCTWLENEYGSFNHEPLKFLMHFRELGSSFYFIFISYILIFFVFPPLFLILIFLFFLYFSHFFSFSFSSIFLFAPLELWNCIVPTSSPMLRRLLVLGQRGDKDKVGTGNFPLERYLKSSMLAPSCDLPWIDDPFSTIGCGQGGNHKRWYLVLKVDIRRGLWDLQCGDTQCMDKRLAKR